MTDELFAIRRLVTEFFDGARELGDAEVDPTAGTQFAGTAPFAVVDTMKQRIGGPLTPNKFNNATQAERQLGVGKGELLTQPEVERGWLRDGEWDEIALWVGCLVIGLVIAFCYLALSAPARRHMTRDQRAEIEPVRHRSPQY